MADEENVEHPDDEKRMTFTEHLGELRDRIIRSGIAVIICVVACYVFSNPIIKGLSQPLDMMAQHAAIETVASEDAVSEEGAEEKPAGARSENVSKAAWTVLNPLEMVILKIKVAGYGGVLLAMPFLLWQLCAFVFPGLHPNEKRAVKILVVGCSCLALVGVIIAYLGILPLVLPYLLELVPEGWEVKMRANETISIIIKLLVGFAIAFQFPMAALILVYMGILSPETLKRSRKVAYVGLAFAAALLTPPDPGSMLIMLAPLMLLYEISILLSYVVIMRKKKKAKEEAA